MHEREQQFTVHQELKRISIEAPLPAAPAAEPGAAAPVEGAPAGELDATEQAATAAGEVTAGAAAAAAATAAVLQTADAQEASPAPSINSAGVQQVREDEEDAGPAVAAASPHPELAVPQTQLAAPLLDLLVAEVSPGGVGPHDFGAVLMRHQQRSCVSSGTATRFYAPFVAPSCAAFAARQAHGITLACLRL